MLLLTVKNEHLSGKISLRFVRDKKRSRIQYVNALFVNWISFTIKHNFTAIELFLNK